MFRTLFILFVFINNSWAVQFCKTDIDSISSVGNLSKYSAVSYSSSSDPINRTFMSAECMWMIGQTVPVIFLNGTDNQKQAVKTAASEWSKYANISFNFLESPMLFPGTAAIKISFNTGTGNYSYVGNCIPVNRDTEWTMSLDSTDEGTILHEFGHALGLLHEHQHPSFSIKWNKDAVYKDLTGPPSYWSKEAIDRNVFDQFKTNSFTPDPDHLSIMMYFIPPHWTLNGFHTADNNVLSDEDKSFIGKMYPFPKPKNPSPSVFPMTVPVGPTISLIEHCKREEDKGRAIQKAFAEGGPEAMNRVIEEQARNQPNNVIDCSMQ